MMMEPEQDQRAPRGDKGRTDRARSRAGTSQTDPPDNLGRAGAQDKPTGIGAAAVEGARQGAATTPPNEC